MKFRYVNGECNMARFSVPVEVSNFGDVYKSMNGELEPGKVRRKTIEGVVDCGASRLVLPRSVAEELDLAFVGESNVTYADGRTTKREVVEGAYIEIQGRRGVFRASVEPNRTTALIGALVLEDFDFLVDSKNEKLVPRDPNGIVCEIG